MKYLVSILFIIFILANIAEVNAQASPEPPVQIVLIVDPNDDCAPMSSETPAPFGVAVGVHVSTEDILQNPQNEVLIALLFDSNSNLVSRGNFTNSTLDPPGVHPISDNLHFLINITNLPVDPLFVLPTSRPWTIKFYSFPLTETLPQPHAIVPPLTELITLDSIHNFTFDPALYAPACGSLPYNKSDPINDGINDLDIQIFNAADDNGEPALHIYDINNEGNGTLALEITQDIIAPYVDNPPSENTALLTSENGKVTLYILDTGELQINSGPDSEGKIHVLIFDGIPPTNIYGYVIDPPMFPSP